MRLPPRYEDDVRESRMDKEKSLTAGRSSLLSAGNRAAGANDWFAPLRLDDTNEQDSNREIEGI